MKAKRIAALLLGIAVAAAAVPRPAQALTAEELPAPSAVLMEASTGKVLFEKNAHEQRACASVTKVMALLLVMEALDAGTIQLTDIVAASDHAASMGGSDIWLEPGEEMSVDDLLKATVIMSANDAAVALAEHVSGSEDAFVEKMNERAAELGMTETVFLNCCGLDEDGHVTTAYDVALMSRALIQHEEIFRYSQTWMDELRGGKTQLVNTNKLLKSYSGITGLKTGSCMAATAERDGMSLVSVVLGCSTTEERFSSAAALLDYGFGGWSVVQPDAGAVELPCVPVTGGMASEVAVQADDLAAAVVEKGREQEVTCEVELQEVLTAPVSAGQEVGSVVCRLDGEVICSAPVRAAAEVQELTFSSAWLALLRALVTLG